MTRSRDLANLADGVEFLAADHTKLDGIEASSDVTDTANVTAAGALMDSELTNLAAVKAINQSLVTTASPTFGGLGVNGTVTSDGLTVDGDLALSGNAVIDGTLAAGNATFSSSEPLITGVDTGLSSRIFTIGGNNGNCIIDVDPNGTAGGSLFQVDVDNGEVLKLTSAGAYVTGLLDVSTNAVIDGTALVTGVLTTTAATVFNGGFAANNAITVTTDGSTKSATFVGNGIEVKATGSNQSNLFIGTQSGNDVKLAVIGAHALRLYTNNTERLNIAADGGASFSGKITANANIETVDGTASLPAITNIGDTNTGIFFPAADKIALSAGGIQRLTMDSNGKIGVGTDDPTSFNSAANQFVISAGGNTGLTIDSTSSTSSSIFFADGPTGTEAYRGYVQYNHADDKMVIGAAAGTRFEVLANGDAEVTNGNLVIGTAGKGIDFSAYGSGTNIDNNLLNDYEEGNWTPVSNNFHTNATYNAKYTKIGRQVTVLFYVVALNGTSLPASIGGLPFTSTNSGYSVGAVNISAANPTTTNIQLRVASNSTAMFVLAANDTSVPASSVDSGHIIGTVTYFTDS